MQEQNRLPEVATTEKRREAELPPAYRVNAGGLPEKVFLLRRKLYREAKPAVVQACDSRPVKGTGEPDTGNP